ncbi:hypothetical protein [Pseudoalteromonas rubra]|uniref:hypothetical protein n=1 Tax=Pseudoalteromonas rubra TaxID=43658 RepID=UPI002DBA0931|nr:hypothetical protein [Pseudoalteromonas rubra]MEC4090225.1 hypothetical protein [Pseudoalteromonas rubra]
MHAVEIVLSSIAFVGLLLTWKDYNARWMFIILGVFQIVESTSEPVTIQWTRHYYLWCVALNALLLALILFRGVLADKLFTFTKVRFFSNARSHYQLTIPECAICVTVLATTVLSLCAWAEIQLYYYDIMSYPFIYHHIWKPAQYSLHILESLALITFITRTLRSHGAPHYEGN